LWQRSPVAQSPSTLQYFLHTVPAVEMAMHAVPAAQVAKFVQGAPTPPSPLGQQAMTAVVPWQPKSHFIPAAQFWAKGSQLPVLVSAALFPSPPPAASGVPDPLLLHAAAVIATTAASIAKTAFSRLTARMISLDGPGRKTRRFALVRTFTHDGVSRSNPGRVCGAGARVARGVRRR